MLQMVLNMPLICINLVCPLLNLKKVGFTVILPIQGVQQKSISNFEGQYATFSFNKNHQIYRSMTPYPLPLFSTNELFGRKY